MKTLRTAFQMLLLLTVITGVVYPLLVTGLAQLFFPAQANGSLLYRNGKPVASLLLAQNMTQNMSQNLSQNQKESGYFWPRPSAGNFDAMASGGSNYGQTSPALMQQWQTRIQYWQQASGNTKPVPAELIQASASGLDPQISVAAAYYQLNRVAQSRGWPEKRVAAMIEQQIDRSSWFAAGAPMINVMSLNLSLDQQDMLHASR
ncbi:MAG: potassium-transporting ATPase subunit KdpC [Tolumonas sp.]|nr:potassium-transporting ATPase subunit KdpC [Tolumonas sp.]